MSINDQQETDPLFEGLMNDTPQCFSDVLPFGGGDMEESDMCLPFIEHNSEMSNSCFGSSIHSNVLQDIHGKIEGAEAHKENSFQRVKWTDDMVKLLITALSYIAEYDASVSHFKFKNGRFFVPKLGKWKIISNVMFQKGYHVSPHQCEDKFNDLIKKYRRVNDLLGRGTACKVVENPKLIGSLNLSRDVVVEVMKILSCKQLFYREMCSYNNRNRLFIPHDESVWNLLKLALKGNGNCSQEVIHEISAKRMKEGEEHGFAGSTSYLDCSCRSEYRFSECEKLPNEWTKSQSLHLEEQKLQIREQRLELEKLRIENQQEDLELEKMRLENKVMKLKNQRLAFKIRC